MEAKAQIIGLNIVFMSDLLVTPAKAQHWVIKDKGPIVSLHCTMVLL